MFFDRIFDLLIKVINMIINIKSNGKILKEKLDLKLPNFVVLTGENGSGKTQLLDYLSDNSILDDGNFVLSDENNKQLKEIIYSLPGITNQQTNEYIIESKSLLQKIQNEWRQLKGIAQSHILIHNKSFSTIEEELAELSAARSDLASEVFSTGMMRSYNTHNNIENLNILKNLSSQSLKHIHELKYIDFLSFYKIPQEIFSSSLEILFHQFNLKQKFYNEWVKETRPPWDIFNEILNIAEFNYKLEYTCSEVDETPSSVFLIDRKTLKKVEFEDLSSGEKTIMSLIFVLYNATSNGKFPEVLLFDEPDAHLHPSMAKLFLDVIQDVLVKEQNVKVILTTHSPSTIALAPSESIYKMDRSLGYPVKENKDSAIQSLSNGLASLSIENGSLGIAYNIKQTPKHILFTEGITDKIIIEISWKKLFGDTEMPFYIQDSFSVNFLGTLFNQGNEKPDGIFHQFPEKALIALFDFDNAGYNGWNRDEKFPNVIENNPYKCLTRHNNLNGYLLLLPAINEEDIKNLVIKNGYETYKDNSKLTIESLFLDVLNFKNMYFTLETVPGGSFYSFKGKKRKFAKNLEALESEHFKNFRPLFDKIEEVIALHNED